MPDYNPKDIPTLDDIVEPDLAEKVESEEAEEVEAPATESDPDLYLDESIDQDNGDTNIDATPIDIAEHQPDGFNEDENAPPNIDVQPDEPAPQVSVEPIPVELIVSDIVKQLMPDLEQKLKLLLQQALEEKLAEETVQSTDTNHKN